jgi:hypothetical protein
MISGHTWTNLINYALFQAGWFICLLGTASGHPWRATSAGLFLVLIHLALVRNPVLEGVLLGQCLLLGLIVDTVHIYTGVLSFPIGSLHPNVPPPWILVLWIQFATTLHYSLRWLTNHYVVGIIFGGVSGALAYWAGVRFGAALFSDDLVRCLVQIGLSWGMVMALLLRVSRKTETQNGAPLYRSFLKKI